MYRESTSRNNRMKNSLEFLRNNFQMNMRKKKFEKPEENKEVLGLGEDQTNQLELDS